MMETRQRRIAVWIGAALAALVLLLAVFPWGLLARHASGPLSNALGRPVSIGSARRVDWIGFVPEIEFRDIRIGQPDWAGQDDMARVATLALRLPVLPLLIGHVRPRAIMADGLVVHLVQDENGRDDWSGVEPSSSDSFGSRIADLTIRNGRLRLDDAERHVALDATLASDAKSGLRIDGVGTLRGAPLHLSLSGPAIAHADPSKPYPVRLLIRSPLVSIDAAIRMDHPLDTEHFAASLRTSGRDLGYLDDIIQAGLFRTQPFNLGGEVRHDGKDWHFAKLDGSIGRSNLTSVLDVTKRAGRTHLTGRVDARTLDFDDFASDGQHAQSAAERRAFGPRVIPGTRVVLDRLDRLDGQLQFKADALLSSSPSPFRALEGSVRLDHQLLTLSLVRVALPKGSMTGQVTVDGRGGPSKWRIDLRIAGASIESFFPDQQFVAGPMRGRAVIDGSGPTLDAAIAHGRGRAALVVDRGTVRHDYATFLGGDVFKSAGALLRGRAGRAPLDCLVGSFVLGNGRAIPDALIVSTPLARGDGTGAILLPSEAIDIRVSGRPTKAGLLQSTAPVRLFGTLALPQIDIRPPLAKNSNSSDLLSRVGFLIKKLHVRGDAEAAPAAPATCGPLIERALR